MPITENIIEIPKKLGFVCHYWARDRCGQVFWRCFEGDQRPQDPEVDICFATFQWKETSFGFWKNFRKCRFGTGSSGPNKWLNEMLSGRTAILVSKDLVFFLDMSGGYGEFAYVMLCYVGVVQVECHQSWRFVGRHFQLYDTSPRIPN